MSSKKMLCYCYIFVICFDRWLLDQQYCLQQVNDSQFIDSSVMCTSGFAYCTSGVRNLRKNNLHCQLFEHVLVGQLFHDPSSVLTILSQSNFKLESELSVIKAPDAWAAGTGPASIGLLGTPINGRKSISLYTSNGWTKIGNSSVSAAISKTLILVPFETSASPSPECICTNWLGFGFNRPRAYLIQHPSGYCGWLGVHQLPGAERRSNSAYRANSGCR